MTVYVSRVLRIHSIETRFYLPSRGEHPSAALKRAPKIRGEVATRDTAWSYAGYSTTGHHLWRALGRQTYAVGFVALSGSSRLGPDSSTIRSDQHPDAELEELMGAAGFQTAFLD